MSKTPDISVVMSVYNGAPNLRETLDSILTQQGVSLEFVIVDDGSTDESAEILGEYERRDPRVKLIRQDKQGLTKALIKGCAAATGKYIARQDAGDISLPSRLKRQFDLLESESGATCVSCGTLFFGPEREHLYNELPATNDLTEVLLTCDPEKIKGPPMHGSTMFPKQVYERVGGYRPPFYFAQDLDLWIRLAEKGRHLSVTDVLYEASITLGSISSRYRKHQVETTRLILESAELRRKGESDEETLKRANLIKPDQKEKFGRLGRADALYFIGACLRQSRNPHAPDYFRRALLTYPLHLRSAFRLLFG